MDGRGYMKIKEIKYALKHVKDDELLGYYTESNTGDFCVDVMHTLSRGEDKKWYAESAEHAEYVRNNTSEWYAASYDTPANPYKPEDLVVLKLTTETEIEQVEIKIPTYEEFAEHASKGSKIRLDWLLKMKSENVKLNYTLYELNEIITSKRKGEE